MKSKILKIFLVSLFLYGDIRGFGIARSAEPNLNPKAATAKFKLCQIPKTRKNHVKRILPRYENLYLSIPQMQHPNVNLYSTSEKKLYF